MTDEKSDFTKYKDDVTFFAKLASATRAYFDNFPELAPEEENSFFNFEMTYFITELCILATKVLSVQERCRPEMTIDCSLFGSVIHSMLIHFGKYIPEDFWLKCLFPFLESRYERKKEIFICHEPNLKVMSDIGFIASLESYNPEERKEQPHAIGEDGQTRIAFNAEEEYPFHLSVIEKPCVRASGQAAKEEDKEAFGESSDPTAGLVKEFAKMSCDDDDDDDDSNEEEDDVMDTDVNLDEKWDLGAAQKAANSSNKEIRRSARAFLYDYYTIPKPQKPLSELLTKRFEREELPDEPNDSYTSGSD